MPSSKILIAALVYLSLTGCANPYNKFYQGLADARKEVAYAPAQGELKIVPADIIGSQDRVEQSIKPWMRKGYFFVGSSSFNAEGGSYSESKIKDQANKIGASLVLVASRQTGSISGTTPLMMPTTSTSYSTGNTTAFGRGGIVNLYGNSSTTTHSSQPVYIPFTKSFSDFVAMFFAKGAYHFGSIVEDVDEQTRKRLGTNAGVKVSEVVEYTPAFRADIFPGDVILAVDEESVYSQEQYLSLIAKNYGRSVTLKIDRDGTQIEKSAEILASPVAAP